MSYMTWNQLGSHVGAAVLMQRFKGHVFDPDYICLQEVGNAAWGGALVNEILPRPVWAPKLARLFSVQGLRLNRETYDGCYLLWIAKAGGNPRCSMAILHRAAFGPHAIDGWWDLNKLHRPAFWIAPAGGGGPAIGCVHAPAGGNAPYIQAVLAAMGARIAIAWRLAGDFNVDYPQLLIAQAAWPFPLNAVPSQSSGGPTQRSGHDLDYSVGTLPNSAICVSADGYYFGSDHLAVAFS